MTVEIRSVHSFILVTSQFFLFLHFVDKMSISRYFHQKDGSFKTTTIYKNLNQARVPITELLGIFFISNQWSILSLYFSFNDFSTITCIFLCSLQKKKKTKSLYILFSKLLTPNIRIEIYQLFLSHKTWKGNTRFQFMVCGRCAESGHCHSTFSVHLL